MKALRVFRGLMAFLTAIPLKMDEEFLELSARFMSLFPLIGVLIGFFAGPYSHLTHNLLSLLFGFLNATFFSGSQNTLFAYLAKVKSETKDFEDELGVSFSLLAQAFEKPFLL